MEGRKDISDMSFEEFFSEKDRAPVQKPLPVRRDQGRRVAGKPIGDVQMGFGPVNPKINYIDRRFLLYVPRYGAGPDARFEVALDCESGVITLGCLESAPRGTGRLSRAQSFDITSEGVSPLENFTLLIDGVEVFHHRPRQVLFFNNIGLPMGKPAGEIIAVYPKGRTLRLVKTEVIETFEAAGVMISRTNVSTAGGIWIDDRRRGTDDEHHAEEPAEAIVEKPAEEPKPKQKPKVKRKKPTGFIRIPQGLTDLDIVCDGQELPVFTSFPAFRVSVENRDLDECQVSLRSYSDEMLAGGKAPVDAPMTFDVDSDGIMGVVLSAEDVELARARFVLIRDLSCDRPGKGDLTSETTFGYTAFGTTSVADAFGDPIQIEKDGALMFLRWNVPAVRYDTGDGEHRYDPSAGIPEVDVDQLGDAMLVSITGARKKSLFIGPDKGKKRDVTPEWTGDSCRIDLSDIKNEIFSSDAPSYTVYITVNSLPMRKFMIIRNPVRMKARLEGGSIVAEVSASGRYVCRFHMIDKTVRTVDLTPGENTVAVPEGSLEAVVAEVFEGSDRKSLSVRIRPMPFLLRDEMGDLWLYVSKDKRIPLPGDLSSSKPDGARIKQWHDQIVRMNPELRNVSAAMMQKAFDDMEW